jgi:hypothetical protein
MRHKGRTMLTALVAVLALGVVASASASAALPEFVPGAGTKFPIALEASMPTARTEINLGAGSGGATGICQGLKIAGSITGAKTLSLPVQLEKCQLGEQACYTTGASEGTENPFGSATLVYINKSKKEVGLLISQAKVKGVCAGGNWSLKGEVVVPITPINTKASSFEIVAKGNGKEVPNYRTYENANGETVSVKLGFGEALQQTALEVSEPITLKTASPLTIDG